MKILRPLVLALLITLVSACGQRAATPPPTSRPATQATAATTAEAAAGTANAPTAEAAAGTANAPTAEAIAAPPLGGATTDVLSGTSWQWVELTDPTQQVQIANPAAYTIAFDAGQVSIQADCNRSTGSYTLADGGALTIALGPTTAAACPPESRSDEFLQKLSQVADSSIQDDRLLLELPADGGTLAFARTGAAAGEQSPPALTGATWQWVGLADGMQQVQIANPASYTIAFADDGSVTIVADCNQASGTYALADGGTITITVGLVTMAACPPESRSDEFLQKLGQVVIYSFQDDRLLLEMPVDSGSLAFQRQ